MQRRRPLLNLHNGVRPPEQTDTFVALLTAGQRHRHHLDVLLRLLLHADALRPRQFIAAARGGAVVADGQEAAVLQELILGGLAEAVEGVHHGGPSGVVAVGQGVLLHTAGGGGHIAVGGRVLSRRFTAFKLKMGSVERFKTRT